MTEPSVAPEIEVRHCTTLDEYEECVRIEHVTWGPELAEPSGMFVVAHHTGGQVLGAFHGAKMVGFTLAIAAVRRGKPFLHSHQTAVLPEYRDHGVGRRLKLAQRDDALKRGINLVEWTFDPLEVKNAYFNLVRLGAISRRFIPNCYGITNSALHSGLPTDRLVVEWWLDSDRVKALLEGTPMPMRGPVERFPLPSNIAEIKATDEAAALRIQTGLRGQFQRIFANAQVVTSIEPRVARVDYIAEPANAIAGLRLPIFHPERPDD
jgi:predicted GNAT superfamily acetyltransferase